MTRIRADSGCPTRLSGASEESCEFRQLNGPFRVGGSVWEPLSWNAADNGTQLAPQYIPQVNGPMGIGALTQEGRALPPPVSPPEIRLGTLAKVGMQS